jgi:hypothetical protein
MKKQFLILLNVPVMLLLVMCSDNGRIKERPDNIVATGERTATYQKIMSEFPEHQNVMVAKKDLFDAGATKQVVLTAESDVYVTFISEGASLPNSFGWYSYTSKPASASGLTLNVLFPHVSERILKQGDRLRLGDKKFPAGTTIGFFLIINGWENGAVNFDRETFYTDFDFNPDHSQQHVLYRNKDLGDVVLTFEDVATSRQSDKDFNDIIFTVSDNSENQAVSHFDLSAVKEY